MTFKRKRRTLATRKHQVLRFNQPSQFDLLMTQLVEKVEKHRKFQLIISKMNRRKIRTLRTFRKARNLSRLLNRLQGQKSERKTKTRSN